MSFFKRFTSKGEGYAECTTNGEQPGVDQKEQIELEEKKSVDAADDTGFVEREQWGSQLDFLLSCLGYSIGLGNVWRFPYLCYTNGGGVFLFAYLVLLGLCILPIMVLEMLFGQFSNLGCISVWRISPLFKGIGFAMALVSAYFCLYYNIIIAYTVYYMVASFKNPLPWSTCDNDWNTEACFMYTEENGNTTDFTDSTVTPGDDDIRRVWSGEEYWENQVLGKTEGLHDLGTIRWELLGCFWLVWLIVYLCIIKGVKTSGKVVYFTAVFPFVILFILLIRGVTLEGAATGIVYFIRPKFELLANAKVWSAAANQVFISFGAGWGGVLTLASYNKYRNNSIRDCCILVAMGCLASVTAGFVVFSVLGFMAEGAGLEIENVVRSGPGLTFIAYPMALARLPIPNLWSVVFFFMLLTLGLDSEFVTLETVITAIVDEMAPSYPWVQKKRYLVILGTCIVMSIVGIPLCLQGGIYIETLIDWYSAGFTPVLLALVEILVICHVYGWRRFRTDMTHMLGFTPSMYWTISWLFLSPLLIVVIFIYTFIDYEGASLGDYKYPPVAQAAGWFLTMSNILCILAYAIYNVAFCQTGSFIERVIAASKPSPEWGPSQNKHRIEAGFEPLPGHGSKDADGIENAVA